MKHLFHCKKCDRYTMKSVCGFCGLKTNNPKPAKYNPEDKYSDYRRKAKKEVLKEKGLL